MAQSTRRAFVQRAAAASIVPALISTNLEAQASAAPQPAAPVEPPKLDPKSPLAKAMADTVRAQWGDYLTLGELALIESDLDRLMRSRLRLREFELANGDEPDSLFNAADR